MRSYSTYAIAVTIRLVTTFFILTVVWYFLYPTIIILILAVCNDGTIMTISRDRVKASPSPDKWNLFELFGVAVIIGLYLTGSTITMFAIVYETHIFNDWFHLKHLSDDQIRGLIYLQVSITGFFSLFFIRTTKWFWETRPAWLLLGALALSQTAATFISVYGFGGYPHGSRGFSGCGWGWAVFAWIWSLLWLAPMDFIKIGSRWLLRKISESWRKKNTAQQKKEPLLAPIHNMKGHLVESWHKFREERMARKEGEESAVTRESQHSPISVSAR